MRRGLAAAVVIPMTNNNDRKNTYAIVFSLIKDVSGHLKGWVTGDW